MNAPQGTATAEAEATAAQDHRLRSQLVLLHLLLEQKKIRDSAGTGGQPDDEDAPRPSPRVDDGPVR